MPKAKSSSSSSSCARRGAAGRRGGRAVRLSLPTATAGMWGTRTCSRTERRRRRLERASCGRCEWVGLAAVFLRRNKLHSIIADLSRLATSLGLAEAASPFPLMGHRLALASCSLSFILRGPIELARNNRSRIVTFPGFFFPVQLRSAPRSDYCLTASRRGAKRKSDGVIALSFLRGANSIGPLAIKLHNL